MDMYRKSVSELSDLCLIIIIIVVVSDLIEVLLRGYSAFFLLNR